MQNYSYDHPTEDLQIGYPYNVTNIQIPAGHISHLNNPVVCGNLPINQVGVPHNGISESIYGDFSRKNSLDLARRMQNDEILFERSGNTRNSKMVFSNKNE